MTNNTLNSLKLTLAVVSPLMISFIINIIDLFFVNNHFYINYFSSSILNLYSKEDFQLLQISSIFHFLSILIFFLLLFFIIYKFKFYNLFSNKIFENKNINYFLLLIIILRVFIIFDTCENFLFLKKLSTFEPIFIFFFFMSLFRNKYCKTFSINSLFLIIFILISIIEAFLGSIYEITFTFLALSTYYFLDNKFITFLNKLLCLILVFISIYYGREMLRHSGYIISGKNICALDNATINTEFAINFYQNIECNGVGPFCKKYVSDKIYVLNNFNTYYYANRFRDNKKILLSDAIYVDNIFLRYNLVRQLNNYVIIFDKKSIRKLNGNTYKILFSKYIPRKIYDEKPIENLGHYIPKKYGLMELWETSSMPVNIFSEAYINFGFFGLIILPFLIFLIFLPYFILLKILKINKSINILVLLIFVLNFQSNLSLTLGHAYVPLFLIILLNLLWRDNKIFAKKN